MLFRSFFTHVATLCVKNGARPGTTIAVDGIGVGASAVDHVEKLPGVRVLPIIGSYGSEATDKSGMLQFKNLRAELHWKFREALDPDGGEELAIEDNPELLSDLTSIRFKVTTQGVQVESKEDIFERIGRSPDRGDSVILAHANPSMPGEGIFQYFKDAYTVQQAELARVEAERKKRYAGH